jgi:uncharacterized protein (TIGR02217 family)
MSNAIFPVMPGLTWDITREPIWSTTVKTAVSGREYRTANWSYPHYHYKMVYSVLRQQGAYAEMAQLAGFFNARQGSYDSFLFTDPDDSSVTAQAIGVGDGSNRLFQLVRTFGGYVEPVFDTNSTPQIYDNGTLKATPADYSMNASGLVTFVAAPAAGHAITWTGSFYRRMRFDKDTLQFSQFMQKLWELKTLDLFSVKP